MTAPQNEYAFDLEVASAAAERWSKREQHHAKFERATRNSRYSELDTPERCAARVNRLLGKLQNTAPDAAEVMTTEFDESIGKEIVSACSSSPSTGASPSIMYHAPDSRHRPRRS